MKSSHSAESAAEFADQLASSAPSHYSPAVPMTVYRELAAELRANKAVIDSLNSRNQQLLNQNRVLKQEIHNVVQAALHLGQFAGVAKQTDTRQTNGIGQSAVRPDFPNAIAPDTLAKLVRNERNSAPEATYEPHYAQPHRPQHSQQRQLAAHHPINQTPQAPLSPSTAPATPRNRVPRPIGQNPAKHSMKAPTVQPAAREAAREAARDAARDAARIAERANAVRQQAPQRQQPKRIDTVQNRSAVPAKMVKAPTPKLFTEKAGSYRSTSLESSEDKEIGGIWLALSIILIIVTAFGAGFLIMKPLLNDR